MCKNIHQNQNKGAKYRQNYNQNYRQNQANNAQFYENSESDEGQNSSLFLPHYANSLVAILETEKNSKSKISATCNEASDKNVNISDLWIADSGASMHMTFHREWYAAYKPIEKIKISIPDGKCHEAVGTGTISIKRKITGNKWIDGTLENVMYVPTFDRI